MLLPASLHAFCRLSVKFTDRYPLEPPEVVFLSPTPIHPHIYRCAYDNVCNEKERKGETHTQLDADRIAAAAAAALACNWYRTLQQLLKTGLIFFGIVAFCLCLVCAPRLACRSCGCCNIQ